MATNDYVFITRWRGIGEIGHAYGLLMGIDDYPRWWPEAVKTADL